MAIAFITVAGQHGTHAQNFYRMFPAETVLPAPQVLSIRRVERIQPATLDKLLQVIALRRDRNAVIVSHGVPTQLAIPVMRGLNIGLDKNFVTAILGQSSNAELARQLHTSATRVATLRRRIGQVHQLNLERVEFRACRVGRDRPTLDALKQLFGAQSATAPRVFDGYGNISNIRPTHDASTLSQWQRSHAGHETYGTAPDRFFWVNRGSSDPPVISAAFAESWDAARAWATAKFPPGATSHFRRGPIAYHVQASMLANSSQQHGQRTFSNSFVFPTDAAYRQNLVRVT